MIRSYANLKLGIKLLIPIVFLVACMAVITASAWRGLSSLGQTTGKIVTVTNPRRTSAFGIARALNNAAVEARNLILETRDTEMQRYEASYRGSLLEALQAAEQLIALSDTPETREASGRVRQEVEAYGRATEPGIQLALNGQREEAVRAAMGPGEEARKRVTEIVDQGLAVTGQELREAGVAVLDLKVTTMRRIALVTAIGLAVSLGALVIVVAYFVMKPLTAITRALEALAHGDLTVTVEGAERKDEVGALARSLALFKEQGRKARELADEKAAVEARAAAEQKLALAHLADTFEQSVGGIIRSVADASTELETAAHGLSGTAEAASEQATVVAASATQATANVQTVAAAAEQLTASIQEISRQVVQATEITSRAVEETHGTNAAIQNLAASAQRIGQVVATIQHIAGQTNLLALNATIEAARAGETGKGFAVVAGEVKALAQQTARATDDITGQISAIQATAGAAVTAIEGIVRTIEQVNTIAAAIAAAVEEQGTATHDIAANVQQAATGTSQVSASISRVNESSGEIGTAAAQVRGAASELSQQSERLSREVDSFLSTVRAA